MKDTNCKTITEEEFMKDIGHGVERTQEKWKKELRDDWMMYHAELYQPGSPINTMTIFDWWIDKLAEERNKVLSEVEREVVKKQYYSDDGQQYVTSIEDILKIINNLK